MLMQYRLGDREFANLKIEAHEAEIINRMLDIQQTILEFMVGKVAVDTNRTLRDTTNKPNEPVAEIPP